MKRTAIEQLLHKNMGLNAASVSPMMVERVVRRRMSHCGITDPDEYLDYARATASELQELVEAIAIPETWFFRDPEAFAALERWVSSYWLLNHGGRTLRLLSVPCSTGEEPYSICMQLMETGLQPGQFHVDALDISGSHLARAREGIYTKNSFRRFSPSRLQAHFKETARGFEIADYLKAFIDFKQANILQADWQLSRSRYQIVFCRNLLIYFDAPTQEQAIINLDRVLEPGGILFVGSAEAFLARSFGYDSIQHPMSFGYRKPMRTMADSTEIRIRLKESRKQIVRRPQSVPSPVFAPDRTAGPISRPAQPTSPPAAKAELTPALDIEAAFQLANEGKTTEARDACMTLLQASPSAQCYYLLGLIADADQQIAEAAEFYRKALYLDPQHGEALLHLALLREQQGDLATAARLRERSSAARPTLDSDNPGGPGPIRP